MQEPTAHGQLIFITFMPQVTDTVAMSTMIGVTLSVLLLAAVFLIFSVYAYKTRTACFGFRKSVFGDEADTQNFRINYPSELIISPPISRPETVPDHEDSEDRVKTLSEINSVNNCQR